MFKVDGIRQFHGWTHACLNIVLDHASTIPHDAFVREVPEFGFSTLQKQLTHVFNCEGAWIHALQKLEYENRTPSEFPSVVEIKTMQRQVSESTLEYLSTLTDRQLNTETEKLPFPDGNIAVRTPALVLHHVFTHAFHHKGQMVTMCRALGYPAPDTDLNWFS